MEAAVKREEEPVRQRPDISSNNANSEMEGVTVSASVSATKPDSASPDVMECQDTTVEVSAHKLEQDTEGIVSSADGLEVGPIVHPKVETAASSQESEATVASSFIDRSCHHYQMENSQPATSSMDTGDDANKVQMDTCQTSDYLPVAEPESSTCTPTIDKHLEPHTSQTERCGSSGVDMTMEGSTENKYDESGENTREDNVSSTDRVSSTDSKPSNSSDVDKSVDLFNKPDSSEQYQETSMEMADHPKTSKEWLDTSTVTYQPVTQSHMSDVRISSVSDASDDSHVMSSSQPESSVNNGDVAQIPDSHNVELRTNAMVADIPDNTVTDSEITTDTVSGSVSPDTSENKSATQSSYMEVTESHVSDNIITQSETVQKKSECTAPSNLVTQSQSTDNKLTTGMAEYEKGVESTMSDYVGGLHCRAHTSEAIGYVVSQSEKSSDMTNMEALSDQSDESSGSLGFADSNNVQMVTQSERDVTDITAATRIDEQSVSVIYGGKLATPPKTVVRNLKLCTSITAVSQSDAYKSTSVTFSEPISPSEMVNEQLETDVTNSEVGSSIFAVGQSDDEKSGSAKSIELVALSDMAHEQLETDVTNSEVVTSLTAVGQSDDEKSRSAKSSELVTLSEMADEQLETDVTNSEVGSSITAAGHQSNDEKSRSAKSSELVALSKTTDEQLETDVTYSEHGTNITTVSQSHDEKSGNVKSSEPVALLESADELLETEVTNSELGTSPTAVGQSDDEKSGSVTSSEPVTLSEMADEQLETDVTNSESNGMTAISQSDDEKSGSATSSEWVTLSETADEPLETNLELGTDITTFGQSDDEKSGNAISSEVDTFPEVTNEQSESVTSNDIRSDDEQSEVTESSRSIALSKPHEDNSETTSSSNIPVEEEMETTHSESSTQLETADEKVESTLSSEIKAFKYITDDNVDLCIQAEGQSFDKMIIESEAGRVQKTVDILTKNVIQPDSSTFTKTALSTSDVSVRKDEDSTADDDLLVIKEKSDENLVGKSDEQNNHFSTCLDQFSPMDVDLQEPEISKPNDIENAEKNITKDDTCISDTEIPDSDVEMTEINWQSKKRHIDGKRFSTPDLDMAESSDSNAFSMPTFLSGTKTLDKQAPTTPTSDVLNPDTPATPQSEVTSMDTPGPFTPISVIAAPDTPISEIQYMDTPGPFTPTSEISNDASNQAPLSEPTPAKRACIGNTSKTYYDEYELPSFPAENLFEYQWPQDSSGEYYLLQEQISEYLSVKSFKRKYPELQRRSVDKKEKEFLRERGVVSETLCDLGLTALRSEEVYDLMHKDYSEKYREYAALLHEKEKQTIKDKHKDYGVPKLEKSKMTEYIKKAMKSASEWNSQFQKERRDERRAYFDLQTFAIHFPVSRFKKMPPETTEVSTYPVALIPGQFQEFYKRYTSEELNYFPINTAIYDPPKKMEETESKVTDAESEEDQASVEKDSSESEEEESEEESSSDSDSSSQQEVVSPVPSPAPTPNSKSKSTPDGTGRRRGRPPLLENQCRICKLTVGKSKAKNAIPQQVVTCSECGAGGHANCLELTPELVKVIKTYPWQCMECKTCVECMDPYDEDKMMFCDRCDRGYHTFCVGVKAIPTGCWECKSCNTTEESTDTETPVKTKVTDSPKSSSKSKSSKK